MTVEELLARAWGAVEKAGIPEPLHEYAFKEALARLGGSVLVPVRAPDPKVIDMDVSNNGTDGGPIARDVVPMNSLEPFSKFSHESGVSVEDLERVFYVSDGVPHLNGPRTKFGRNTADQAKVVAVALTAAYDFMLDETPISDEVVRAETTRLKIDLNGNWSRTMGSLSGASWIGASRQKQFKTTNSAADSLRKLVSSILGASAE